MYGSADLSDLYNLKIPSTLMNSVISLIARKKKKAELRSYFLMTVSP